MNELKSGAVYLSSHKKGQSFDESFKEFISKSTRLVQKKLSDEELEDFADELTQAIGECVSWTYFTRGHRDRALGQAFEDRPKAGRNSEEQIATARAAATVEVRNHELVKELAVALKERLWLTRQRLEMRSGER